MRKTPHHFELHVELIGDIWEASTDHVEGGWEGETLTELLEAVARELDTPALREATKEEA